MRLLLRTLIGLAVPLLLVASTVLLLASEPYLSMVYARPGFPSSPGIDDGQRMALALPSTRFIVTDMPAERLAALELDGAALYTESEIEHLLDVRAVVAGLMALAGSSLVLLIASAVLAWRSAWLKAWFRALEIGAGGSLLLLVLLVPTLLFFFGRAFTIFHELLFEPGTWQFSADSGLIRLFPTQFWYDSALVACGLLVLGALVIRWLAGRLRLRLAET